ncbi:MAG: SpoIIE family protein phosphatase [Spirochaetaceae bacterium]|jgi:serine phosphatase RsbU (regulator of sigma subunit)|nr:SpoIIE family protein phosphatase [Spirochaetaceae bacterium]
MKFRWTLPPVFVLLLLVSPNIFCADRIYWDNPVEFSPASGSFPQTAYGQGVAVVGWQETVGTSASGQIYISVAVNSRVTEGEWVTRERLAGPYGYAINEPSMFTLSVDKTGRIFVCIAASTSETEILVSEDGGLDFKGYTLRQSAITASGEEGSDELNEALAPRIFHMADNSAVMFALRLRDRSLNLYYARSEDGYTWSPFTQFVRAPALQLNFLPTHATIGGTDYIVFQSLISGTLNRPSYQLYLKTSSNGGMTWTEARRITTFTDSFMATQANPDGINNERAHLSVSGGSLFLVWERRDSSGSPQIYGAVLNPDGALAEPAERINSRAAYCNNPVALEFEGKRVVIWFDNRIGQNEAFMAVKYDDTWQDAELSRFSQSVVFARPALANNAFYVFWQEVAGNKNRIYILSSDENAPAAQLAAGNFTDGRRVSSEKAMINWKVPYDSSGVRGYSWEWSRDPDALPPELVMMPAWETSVEKLATEDGNWYFTLIVQDNADNWSEPSRITFVRDTTPPPAAAIVPPALDGDGFLLSNTFTMRWSEPPASDLAGYAWSLDYLAPPAALADTVMRNAALTGNETSRALRNRGPDNHASFTNEDDGWWRFSVVPLDNVGNAGPASYIVFKTNKYIPHTFITLLDYGQDVQGVLSMAIIGRGFSESGAVDRIVFRRNGQAVRELSLANGDYTVRGDREIRLTDVEMLPEGSYYVVVRHPLRGEAVSPRPISIAKTFTVKFGNFTNIWQTPWITRLGKDFVFDIPAASTILVIVFCAFLLLLTTRGIGVIMKENKAVRVEALALLNEEFMPVEKKRQLLLSKKRILGLRLKFASFILALVLIIVIMLSLPLFISMSNTQRQTLMQGLWDRSSVLLEALTRSSRVFMPSNSVLELGYLPAQIASVPEAHYVTITGFGTGDTVNNDYVWATNDPEILIKINTNVLELGVSRIKDDITPALSVLNEELNGEARYELSGMTESIAQFNRESMGLLLATDAESRRRLEDIQVTTRDLENRITMILDRISANTNSYPALDIDNMDMNSSERYLLYKPVMFHQSTSDIYVRGIVRLEVSNETILAAIRDGQLSIIRMILYVAVIAIAIGGIGAVALSSLIILPIRRLVRHVEQIRDTENKAELEGVEIVLKTNDELAVLAETINDMTHGLVKAAKAAEDLSIGKEIQKKFIPLETDRDGNKLTYGSQATKNTRFFGYYEGAKGVSGDYFDYQDIDGRYFAIIKCDVAGKGVPAALIMAQVATMFRNYFKTWTPTKEGMRIEPLVYLMNDFIETLGFKGRFAAFTLCIFDSAEGLLRFCNAGDNLIHWYDHSESKLKTITLPQTPAVGVLPNFILEASNAYQIQSLRLDHGDMLLMYTDGIEEAKRLFRDANYNEIVCAYKDLPNDSPHGSHVVGQNGEELGAERVSEIINAVMNKGKYKLYKYHNPLGEVDYNFDFSACRGTVEEVIMAMVSIEKVFRMYKRADAGSDVRILVDGKVNSFLRDYFLEYRVYCRPQDHPENPMYVYYDGMSEDEQYDDLTILGLHWK